MSAADRLPGLQHKPNEKHMKQDNSQPDNFQREDELRSEYDLKRLRVRRLGPGRNSLGGTIVRLEPGVAEMFPNADTVQ
jgi:hypothetical protein